MNFQVSLGDLIVAATVSISVIAGYFAMKGQLETFRRLLDTFDGRMDSHAGLLRLHTKDLRFHGRKLAAIEGKVFEQPIRDRMPGESDREDDDGL